MITLEKIEHEIMQTMEEPMSLHSVEKLNSLYKAKRNLIGYEAHIGRLSREEAQEWVQHRNMKMAQKANTGLMSRQHRCLKTRGTISTVLSGTRS